MVTAAADETTPLNGNGVDAAFGYGAGFGPTGMERRNSKFRRQSSAIHALSTAEHLAISKSHAHEGHRRQSIIDVRNPEKPSRLENMYGAVVDVHTSSKKQDTGVDLGIVAAAASQIPAIVIACAMNLMVGLPFGASYFPVGWASSESPGNENGSETSDVHGDFPLGGKEALGLRMFLFSTAMAQLVFTFKSKFDNGIGLQMVENVPFCLALADIVIKEQGYGVESLSTLFFLFGASSVIVGLVFYLLGHFKLGRVVYFFPSHVLVGCIGGIGLFIFMTALEVTTNTEFKFTLEGLHTTFIDNFHLIGVVLLFEVTLRLLMYFTRDENGKPKYALLGPIYYCAITPIFYLFLWIFGVSTEKAMDAGFFFPPLESGGSSSIFLDESMFDIFTVVNFSTISWTAVAKSIPTVISLTAFSLIHVPINIPAFAISTNTEPDMDAELVAHGWSNACAGIFGGLQNYMTYCNSVIYSKSKGNGKISSLAIVCITALLFIVGPTIASYVPRAMAGTLLLHIGIDLFLEGVYDSYGDYDALEYAGIWLITMTMVSFGMDAALIAGAAAALSTYVAQSIIHEHPIKGQMSAASLRSSSWNRAADAREILSDVKTGRHKIHLFLIQGHVFFGNAHILTDSIKTSLANMKGTPDEPKIVILDFTSVLGMDSSAAQAIAKLKDSMNRKYDIVLSIFVTGNTNGFPCEYDLSKELSHNALEKSDGISSSGNAFENGSDEEAFIDDAFACLNDDVNASIESANMLSAPRMSISLKASMATGAHSLNLPIKKAVICSGMPSSRVCQSLDEALTFAEDLLIAMADPHLLEDDLEETTRHFKLHREPSTESAVDEDKLLALRYLGKLFPTGTESEIRELFSFFSRESYSIGDVLWTQGSRSDSCKLLVTGSLLSNLEDEGYVEEIIAGSTVGELGLVHGAERLTTLQCVSDRAVLFSLSREQWEQILLTKPRLANHFYSLVVRYLAHRVQHVSNRVLESRSLPV